MFKKMFHNLSENIDVSPKQKNKVHLAVEELDERIVPAAIIDDIAPGGGSSPGITFGSNISVGTFAYNHETEQFRWITTKKTAIMEEGKDGFLYASFSDGTWRYNYFTDHWTLLSAATATELSAASDNTMVGSYASGTWEWDGAWQKHTSAIATELAVSGDNHFFGNYSSGVWEYDNGWTKISTSQSQEMDAADGTLFASYDDGGAGVWRYNAADGWLHTSGDTASQLVAIDSDTFYGAYDSGLWHYEDGVWDQMTESEPTDISGDSMTPITGVWSGSGLWVHEGDWDNFSNIQPFALA